MKKIEDAAALNAKNKAPYVITASARGTSASATVNIGVNNDFTPLDSASTAYVDLSDATRIALAEADGLEAEDIARYVMHYSLVFNKDRARLNAGNAFTVEDEYSSKLAVDVNSISIVTKPEAAVSAVSYDLRDNVIYFTIPDETRVEVEFDAILLNPTANTILVSNEARILHYKKALSDEIDCIGANGISDLTPGLLVRVYPSGHMEAGLNGAKFQLFEYNDESYSSGNSNTVSDWTPVVLKPGTEDEHSATFTTSQLTVDDIDYGDGYAEICLNEDVDGQTLAPGKVYGLREIETPVSTAANGDTIHYSDPHTSDFYCYVFSIGDSADYANGVYRSNDVLSIRNEPTGISMTLKARLGGNCTLTDEAKSALTFQLFRKAVPEEGQPAVYMPVMTERENGEGLTLLDPVVITYDQASSEIGIDMNMPPDWTQG